MKYSKVTAVYFSPTGGTREYVRALAKRLDAQYSEINLTDRETRMKPVSFDKTELVILGAPVYSGRLPVIENGIFQRMSGHRTPAVFLVSYGNRAYEDALLELKNLCESMGFVGVAAGAFIAPHTYSSRVASGRPDKEDLDSVDQLAAGVIRTLEDWVPGEKELKVKGNIPYREIKENPFAPKGDSKCNRCGVCVAACPTGAISANDPKKTNRGPCIACFACVRVCPQKARDIRAFPFRALVKKLEAGLMEVRAQPELFFL